MNAQPIHLVEAVLLAVAIAFFVAGSIVSWIRLFRDANPLRLAAKSTTYWGACLVLAAMAWHAKQEGFHDDNFQTLAGLGILLALFILYIQRARPILGLDAFILPVISALWICALIFGRWKPGHSVKNLWSLTHSAASYSGAIAFAVAAAAGANYLLASSRLRTKKISSAPRLPSLERLEHVTQLSARIGFALLTIGMVTGLIAILHGGSANPLGPHWITSPKVILATIVWIVYAVALHSPITPSVRGRKSAILSIVGFVVMFATVVTVLLMPGGR